MSEVNIIICGVGGQGVVLMSELLGESAVRDGLKVQGSEVLGMAQRGGSVFSNIRLGDSVYAPLTPEGRGDVLVSLEPSESLRNLHFLAPASDIVLNSSQVIPYTVHRGESTYPEMSEILKLLREVTDKVRVIDATELAREAGNPQCTNVVMLGAMFSTQRVPIRVETLKQVIEERFAPKVAAINLKAFELGAAAVQAQASPTAGS